MTNVEFGNQYLDPRWLARSADIKRRDNYTCQECGCPGGYLQVHHRYYERGRDLWDYSDDTLVTYCKQCHDNVGSTMRRLRQKIGAFPLAALEQLSCLLDSIYDTLTNPAGDSVAAHRYVESLSEIRGTVESLLDTSIRRDTS